MNDTDFPEAPEPNAPPDEADGILDQALQAAREDAATAEQEAIAVQRVRRALAEAPKVRGVTDYAALVPDYVAGNLSAAQVLLFEQELKESASLRQMLAAARADRDDQAAVEPTPVGTSRRGGVFSRGKSRGRRPARALMAVAAAVVVAVAAFLLVPSLIAPDQARIARVSDIDGSLYRAEGVAWMPLADGEWIDGGDTLAASNDGSALLTLNDGSVMEVGPRSQLALARRDGGTRVRIDRGRVIVQAVPQGAGTLDVVTDDLTVAVTGTTFEVRHGTKGSRVSVIEGEVEVRRGGESTQLGAGEQIGTRKTATPGVEAAVAWSRDAERYAAQLRAYSDIKKRIEDVLTTTRRHSTRLLDLMPASTSGYVAVPNAPATISQAYEVVEAIATSSLGGASTPEFAPVGEFLAWFGKVGDHLGDETVVGWWRDADTTHCLILSEVRGPGLRSLIDEMLPTLLGGLDAGASGVDMDIVDTPATRVEVSMRVAGASDFGMGVVETPGEAKPGRVSIWLPDGLVAVSTSPQSLQALEEVLGGDANAFLDTELYASLEQVYQRGAEYLVGLDLVALGLDELPDPTNLGLLDLGGAVTATIEHRQAHERTSTSLDVRFDIAKADRIPWLDRPGPMGALEFFSPETTVAGAFVVRNPRDMLERLSRDALADGAAVELVEDLLASFGGELAVAVDGPLLPLPAWKAVFEVYDRGGFQDTVESLVARIAAMAGGRFGIEPVPGVSPTRVYRLTAPGFSAYYSYIDGYVVAASSEARLEHARQVRTSGRTLLDDHAFQKLLPLDTYVDFSAVGYSRLGEVLPESLFSLPGGNAGLGEMIRQLAGTALVGVYNEPDRVRFVTNGNNAFPFLGLPPLPGMEALMVPDAGGGT